MVRPDIDALWDYRDPVESERRFRALIPVDDAPVDAGWHAALLSQLARAVCLQRRYDDAHAILDRAWEIIEAVFDPDDPLGWAHEEYAECLRARGHIEESRPHFRRAFARLSNDPWFPPGETERLARLERLGD